jgi:hypothetical protein
MQTQMCQWYVFINFLHSLFLCYPIYPIYLMYLVIEFLQAAIISLGLIGAGTNNARIAGMLRNLSSYYYKEAAHLFCVSIHNGHLASFMYYNGSLLAFEFNALINFIVSIR